ncbi:P-loop containing nucleoside triphosphate hydrolase protein [Spinellus fusiger]|nr:P-loop containing nucleoside triphosphate hydrolase protein [Spinellus fusiger]
MTTLLQDTLRKSELEQASLLGCRSQSSLSMQDYGSLGITSIQDRKKLFQLVQTLRQELPTLENGLVSSPVNPPPTGLKAPQSYRRRPIDKPPILYDPTRTRSHTLPDQACRPELKKTNITAPDLYSNQMQEEDNEEDDEDESRCEIRRGSGPLLDPYGIPIHRRAPAKASQSQFTSLQSDLNQKIRVCVRKRPLNKKELERSEKDIAPCAGARSINVNEPNVGVGVGIYQRTAQPLVKYIFEGGKATCFAYGQTGSGKTFTMLDPKLGLYVLAARDVFSLLRQPQYQHLTAWIGFYEIYQGQLYDLLNSRKKLFAREDGKQNVVIVGLKEYVIKNVDDLMQVFEYGSQARSTGSTGANSDSSRSHAVLQILLRPEKSRKKIAGKLSFIDLAGSERGADRGDADVKTRMEGAEINKSLLALKECIRALDQDKRHTPFRQSKLTQVLKDSFVGNSRTCMIATISPNQSNSEHTLNTLRYADRVKELKGERDRRGMSESAIGDARPLDDADYNEDNEVDNEIDYPESDDPELYNDGEDDDLFLDDEYFPSDGDVNILDEELPHENTHHSHRFDYVSSSPETLYDTDTRGHQDESVLFDPKVIDEFIKVHRAQVREVTECSKRETKLLANFSLGMSSRKEMDDNGSKNSLMDDLKTSSEFIDYLDNLDEVLEMKMAAIEALRDRIRSVLGEEF